jgi:hypothetical protein
VSVVQVARDVPFVVRYSPQVNDEQLRVWIASGRIASVQFDPEQPSLLSSLLLTVIPFILILAHLLPADPEHAGRRRPGHAVRTFEGEEGHEGHPEGDVR